MKDIKKWPVLLQIKGKMVYHAYVVSVKKVKTYEVYNNENND
jgi:hypothetical protein